MSKLITLTFAALCLPYAVAAELSIDQMPDLPAPDTQEFDPAQHLCHAYQRALETYEQAHLWLDYMRALNVGEANIEPGQCNGSLLGSITRSVLSSQVDDAAALSSIIAIWGGTFHRGASDTISPEGRYANDVEALGLLTLACRRFGKEEMLECIRYVVQYDYNGYVESSPIFCDFSTQETYSEELRKKYVEAYTVVDTIPGTCRGLLSEADGPTEQQQNDWWERVSNALMIDPDFGR